MSERIDLAKIMAEHMDHFAYADDGLCRKPDHIWPGRPIVVNCATYRLAESLAAIERLAEPYLGQPDAYQHYALQIGDEVHLAILLDDLRTALAGVQP